MFPLFLSLLPPFLFSLKAINLKNNNKIKKKAYGIIVKMKQDDLKATLTVRNREAKQLTQKE